MNKPPQFSRAEKRMMWCVGLSCSALAVGATLSARANAEPDWNLPSVALPVQNGADLYLRAANAITWSRPAPDPIEDYSAYSLTRAQRDERYGLKRRQAWLKANAAGFALFERARELETRYPTPYAERMPLAEAMRKLGKYKVAQTNTLAMEKQWSAATHATLDAVELTFDVSRGAPLSPRLTAIGTVFRTLKPLDETETIEQLTATEADVAVRRLEKLLEERPSYADTLEIERWNGVAYWQKTMSDPGWRAAIFQPGCTMTAGKQSAPTAFDKAATKAGYAAVGFGMGVVAPNRTIIDNHHRVFDWATLNCAKPYGAALDAEPKELDWMTRLMCSRYLRGGLKDEKFRDAREQTALRLLLLRLALQSYRQKHGSYPAALHELKPQLKALPTDPFSAGQAFGFRREGKTYRLWSVGPDGRDDGGKQIVAPPPTFSLPFIGPTKPRTVMVRQQDVGDWVAKLNS